MGPPYPPGCVRHFRYDIVIGNITLFLLLSPYVLCDFFKLLNEMESSLVIIPVVYRCSTVPTWSLSSEKQTVSWKVSLDQWPSRPTVGTFLLCKLLHELRTVPSWTGKMKVPVETVCRQWGRHSLRPSWTPWIVLASRCFRATAKVGWHYTNEEQFV